MSTDDEKHTTVVAAEDDEGGNETCEVNQNQSNDVGEGLWSFRPSALQLDYKNLERHHLHSSYLEDCRRADAEGVCIPPRTTNTTGSTTLRTLQWNIHNFRPPCERLDHHPKAFSGILPTLDKVNADVLVLNEYTWTGNRLRQPYADFESALKVRGYARHKCRALVATAIFTRVPVDQVTNIALGTERHALAMRLVNENVWIYGTHLTDEDRENGAKR
jgi:hypothetical protein